MKIIRENAVYVQSRDIDYLMQSRILVPQFICTKPIGNLRRNDFVKFVDPEKIAYFNSLDWIIDFDKYSSLTEKEIILLGQEVVDEKNQISKEFYGLDDEVRSESVDMLIRESLLNFKMYALRDLLWQKKGYISFQFPEELGYENPEGNLGFIKKLKAMIKK